MAQKIRTAVDNPEFQDAMQRWIAEQAMPVIHQSAYDEAQVLAERYDVDPGLALLALVGQLHRSSRALVAWMAAEMRYHRHTLQDLADALQYASNSHVKRAHPELDAIVEVLHRVQDSGKPETVSIHGQPIILKPYWGDHNADKIRR